MSEDIRTIEMIKKETLETKLLINKSKLQQELYKELILQQQWDKIKPAPKPQRKPTETKIFI